MTTLDEAVGVKPLSVCLTEPLSILATRLAATISVECDALAELAAMSYEHENGFAKLVIGSDGLLGSKLRIHYWRGRQQFGSIHDHSFEFDSVVLFGSLIEETYALAPSAEKIHLLDLPNLMSKGNGATPHARTELAELQLVETRTLARGTYRTHPTGLLHRVMALAPQGTATLCAQRPHSRSSSVVVTSDFDVGKRAFERRYFSVPEFRTTIEEVLLQISDGKSLSQQSAA